MELGMLYIALGIAAFGYFISEGMKNFKNPAAKNFMDHLNDETGYELIKESNVHYFIGIEKGDVKSLLEKFPDIPHIKLNNNIYFPKEKLQKWLIKMGD